MLIFVAFLYFCLACSAIWLAGFPAGRDFLMRQAARAGRRLDRGRARWQRGRALRRGAWRQGASQAGNRLRGLLLRHAIALGAAAVMLAVPTIVALGFSTPGMLPGFDENELPPNPLVAELLKGEQLAPPAALPPLAFTTEEVTLLRPMLADASRNWGLLHPLFAQQLLHAFRIMKERHGYDMALLEGYRSPARQDRLAAMGKQVSNARAFQSYHQYGLAADCAFWRDGKLVISEKDPWAMRGYRLYGAVAEEMGLTWGGRWTMMDLGHTELRLRGVIRK